MEWLIGLGVIIAVIIAIIFMVSPVVRYHESVEIAAPVEQVYDHIRFQERLMRWSAWPPETGSSCTLGGQDGKIGAQTIFFDKKGARFGFQEIVDLEPNKRVAFTLTSKGPEQKTKLAFNLEPIGASHTRVVLDFDNRISRPFNVLLRLFGIVRWTREMHLKDLSGLKRYAEPPHLTYTGEPASELQAG